MNLTKAAAVLGVSPRTLHLAVERREIAAVHPLPDGPWVFCKQALETEAPMQLVQRIRREQPTIPIEPQPVLDFQST
jgi:hypothetical protein